MTLILLPPALRSRSRLNLKLIDAASKEVITFRDYFLNKNYRKLTQKLTKITLFTTKIIINCSKLTKIILKEAHGFFVFEYNRSRTRNFGYLLRGTP